MTKKEIVRCSRKLQFASWDEFRKRLETVAQNPHLMTAHELNSTYFLDKLFWERFGKGCHTLKCRHWTVAKQLEDATYMSNSGKTKMGQFMPYFEVTNTISGKKREIGMEYVIRHWERQSNRRPNRRNDPDRNYGLPNSRGYR